RTRSQNARELQESLMERLGMCRKSIIVQAICLALLLAADAAAQTLAVPPKTPPILGAIKTVSGDTMIVAADTGTETKVTLSTATRLLRVPPGSKDLSQAVAIPLSEFQPGDRVLVRLHCTGDATACEASAVIAMKKSDIAEKQAHEREEWQRHGIGGLVKS